MKFTKILSDILVIASVIYLWVLPVLGYKKIIEVTNTDLAFAILALGLYLSNKFDELKQK